VRCTKPLHREVTINGALFNVALDHSGLWIRAKGTRRWRVVGLAMLEALAGWAIGHEPENEPLEPLAQGDGTHLAAWEALADDARADRAAAMRGLAEEVQRATGGCVRPVSVESDVDAPSGPVAPRAGAA